MASNYVNFNGDYTKDPIVRNKTYHQGHRPLTRTFEQNVQGDNTLQARPEHQWENEPPEISRSHNHTGQRERVTGRPGLSSTYSGGHVYNLSEVSKKQGPGISTSTPRVVTNHNGQRRFSPSFIHERPYIPTRKERQTDFSTADQVQGLANTLTEVLQKIEEIKDFAGLINEMNFKLDQVLQQNNELRDVFEELRYDVSVLRNDTLRPTSDENDRFYDNDETAINDGSLYKTNNKTSIRYDSGPNVSEGSVSSAHLSDQEFEEDPLHDFERPNRQMTESVKSTQKRKYESENITDESQSKSIENLTKTGQADNNFELVVSSKNTKEFTKHLQNENATQLHFSERQEYRLNAKQANADLTELILKQKENTLSDEREIVNSKERQIKDQEHIPAHTHANTNSTENGNDYVSFEKPNDGKQERTDKTRKESTPLAGNGIDQTSLIKSQRDQHHNRVENTNHIVHDNHSLPKSLTDIQGHNSKRESVATKYKCKRTVTTEDNRFSYSSITNESINLVEKDEEDEIQETEENTLVKESLERTNEAEESSSPIKQRDEGQHSEENPPVPKDDHYLEQLSLSENAKARDCIEPKSTGTDTVICIDSSESMKGKPFQQCIDFVNQFVDYIEEWASEYQIEENIAIVHFGSEAKILQQLTNDYNKVRESIENLSTKGPTPMMTGLVIAMSALFNRGGPVFVHERQINPRVILLSDGHATDYRIFDGPDIHQPNGYSKEMVKARLEDFADRVRLEDRYIVTIPVGDNPCMDILEPLAKTTGGFVSSINSVKELSRSFLMEVIISQTRNEGITEDIKDNRREIANIVKSTQNGIILNEDEIDIIVTKVIKETEEQIEIDKIRDMQRNEIDEDSEMEVGLRVRRGPNWEWGDQDGDGIGTVIGHKSRGYVRVKWDCGNIGRYRHGIQNAYDLIVVDEPRALPEDVMIAEGVYVRKGMDWEWEGQDGGEEYSVGCVYHIEDEGIVHVRWQNGMRGNYRFGGYGKMDLEVVSPSEYEEIKFLRERKMKEESNQQQLLLETDSLTGSNVGTLEEGGHAIQPTENASKASGNENSSSEEPVKFEEVTLPGVWQYKDDGQWKDYTESDNQRIEKQYVTHKKGTLIVNVNGENCRVIIHKNKQKNTKTGAETDIRRIEK